MLAATVYIWLGFVFALVAVVGGFVAIAVFLTGLLLVWQNNRIARKRAIRGFEVKLTTGGTPVLLKEDNHG